MTRKRKIMTTIGLMAAIFALYLSYFYVVRPPLNDALIEAVKKNNLNEVKSLLARGADINCRERIRFSAHLQANPPQTMRTPLYFAASFRNLNMSTRSDTSILDFLLAHGADPNIGDAEGTTPLFMAASIGDLAAVQVLLSHGAKINVGNGRGYTPLTEAAYRNNTLVVLFLLSHGAPINIKDSLGFSALARTTGYNNNPSLMKVLLAHGADVNSRDKLGRTPLMGAANYGRIEGMKILLQHGADPKAKNLQGETALSIAEEYGTKKMDKWQDGGDNNKIAQRKALMRKLLKSPVASR